MYQPQNAPRRDGRGGYPGAAESARGARPAGRAPRGPGRLRPMLAMALIAGVSTAPLAVLAGGVDTIIGTTQVAGLGLVYLLIAVALLAFALASSALVSHTGVAVGIHTYVARGLGDRMGAGVGMVAVLGYNAYATGYFGVIGLEVAKQISAQSGHQVPWLVVVIPFVLLVAFLGTRSLQFNAIVLSLIGVAMVLTHFVFDITALTSPAGGVLTTDALSPASLFTGSVGAIVGFSITAYPGIETPMAFGADLKATNRQVTNATYIGIILAGGMHVAATWAVTNALGTQDVLDGGGDRASDPTFNWIAAHLFSGADDLFGILIVIGVIGCVLVYHAAAARYMRSMATAGLLPAGLAKRTERGVPLRASMTQTGITLIVLVAFGLAGADPLWDVFMVLSHIASIGIFLALVIAAVAVMAFLLRGDSEDGGFLGWEGRLVAAIVAILCLGAVLVFALLEAHIRLAVATDSPLVYVPPAVVLAALLAGLYLSRGPRKTRSLALEEPEEETGPAVPYEAPLPRPATNSAAATPDHTAGPPTPYRY